MQRVVAIKARRRTILLGAFCASAILAIAFWLTTPAPAVSQPGEESCSLEYLRDIGDCQREYDNCVADGGNPELCESRYETCEVMAQFRYYICYIRNTPR